MTHLQFLGRTFQNMSWTSQQVPGPTVPVMMMLLPSAQPIPILLWSFPLASWAHISFLAANFCFWKDSKMVTQAGLLLSTVNVSLNSRKRLVVEIWV